MKTRHANFLWGFVLILAGGLFLAQNLGYIPVLSEQFWMAAFAGISLVFFVAYFLSGIQNWGLLFPVCIFGGLALTIFFGNNGQNQLNPWRSDPPGGGPAVYRCFCFRSA